MRIIGMDIHRVAVEIVALQDGSFKKLGRIPMLREALDASAWKVCFGVEKDPRLEWAPGAGQASGGGFDRAPGLLLLELHGAQVPRAECSHLRL